MQNSKITIICLGKYKEKPYLELEKEYLKRLSPFAKLKIIELAEEPYGKNADMDRVKLAEAVKIKKQIPKDGIVLILEEKGTLRDSIEFAKYFERLVSIGQELVFILGSGAGLHSSINEISNYSISLSKLTFPHNLARILLIEQIYRAYTIISGKSYHK